MSFGQRDHYMTRNVPLARGPWTKPKPEATETEEVSPRVMRKRLRRRCDRYCSLLVRKLYGPMCFTCKVRPATENGHFFTRKIHATRWDWHEGGNCMPSCSNCNYAHQHNKDPYTFALLEAFGPAAFAALRDRAFSGRKFSLIDLQELAAELRFQLR